MSLSLAQRVRALPKRVRAEWARSLTDLQAREILNLPWWFMRRPEQEPPPGGWLVWLILSGRGWGKSRTGAETLLDWILDQPEHMGVPTEWAIIGETKGDAREICVLGPSGIVRAMLRRGLYEGRDWTYNRSIGVIVLHGGPHSDPRLRGQKVHVLGADDADVARGLNLSGAWLDELAKWQYPSESWTEGIAPSLRIGDHPRCIVTTTPKPIPLLREWVKRTDGSVHVTRGSTFDNAVNLSRVALEELRKRYDGTRIGRQELHGELLDDVEGALWQRGQIDADRVDVAPALYRVVVAVDPAVTSGEKADETGIIVAGREAGGDGYVLADRSLRTTPMRWAQVVVDTYDEHHADVVVIEVNQGGEALRDLLHTIRPTLPVEMVTAKKSKRVRAEPVSALYEQHRIHHVGPFNQLEDQLCEWTPELVESPDRMDALVYAFLHLFDHSDAGAWLAAVAPPCPACGVPMQGGACVNPFCPSH